MSVTNGRLFQRTLSKAFHVEWVLVLLEVILLLLIGAAAVALHAKLRLGLHMPGRYGLIYMGLVVAGRLSSRFSFAASLSSLGASALLATNMLGFDDPFMPVVYILLGFIMDLLFTATRNFGKTYLGIALVSGLSWACIPLLRLLIGSVVGLPYHSLGSGLLYPLASHILFGFTGGLAGALLVKGLDKLMPSR